MTDHSPPPPRPRSQARSFVSLDRRDQATGEWCAPDRDELAHLGADGSPLIGRGSGISFVGASFGPGVRSVSTRSLPAECVAAGPSARIRVGAGVTLAELYRETVSRGVYLPVLPGHPQITVGGCIACNVHGKNPTRHGTFVDYVEAVELFHPDHGVLRLSRDESAELFELTCGGLGLTGIILSATLRLATLPSAGVVVRRNPVDGLAATAARLAEGAEEVDFLHSWNDFSIFDGRLGRGYVATATFAGDEVVTRRDPLAYPRHDAAARAPRVRWFRPSVLRALARAHRFFELRRGTETVELYDFVFPGMDFRNAGYYDAYGPRGMIAHVVLIPQDRIPGYLEELACILRRHRNPLLIASMKPFRGRGRWLRFDGDGIALHAHLPNDTRGQALAGDLEALALDARAARAVYLDSRVTRAQAEAGYPEIDAFRSALAAFDPRRRFRSTLSLRLAL